MKKSILGSILAASVLSGMAASTPADRFARYRETGGRVEPVMTVPHELDNLLKTGHIQGMGCSEQGIFLSHAGGIEKIDWNGRLLARYAVPPVPSSSSSHLGDSFVVGGKVYAVTTTRFWSDGKWRFKAAVGVWDENLTLLKEKTCMDVALDGIVVLGDTIYTGIDRWGAGSKPHADCCVKRLDLDLNDLGDTDIPLPFEIYFGVQTMATDGKDLLFGCYGGTARVSPDLKTVVKVPDFGCGEGFAQVPAKWTGTRQPVFAAVRAMGGNQQGWRKDPENNPPRIKLSFYAWDAEKNRMRDL